jgi:surface protein
MMNMLSLPVLWCIGAAAADTGYVMDDFSILRTAVRAWLADPTAAEESYGHISTWETGGVTMMSWLFCADSWYSFCNTGAANFNEDISAWNTSGVTTMERMFLDASSFNQPLGDWQVDSVTNMYLMFGGASAFNQPLSDWRLDSLLSMSYMFSGASAFDQNFGWCVDDDISMTWTFKNTLCESTSCGVLQGDACTWAPTISPAPTMSLAPTLSFLDDSSIRTAVAAWFDDKNAAEATYGHISTWKTRDVTDMSELFEDASSFNEDISAWDTSSVTAMWDMFKDASSFNQNIGGWNVEAVINMASIFDEASAFDQDLGWCVDDDVDLDDAWYRTMCADTSCGILWGGCDIASTGNVMVNWKIRVAVTAWLADPTAAEATYGHISTWETGGVTDMAKLICADSDCKSYSREAVKSFNEDISAWDTSAVTTMSKMFWHASSFNQDIGGWDVGLVTDMRTMFSGHVI